MRFDWDPAKAISNVGKHRVSFAEACTVFADRSILTLWDETHSDEEDRWVSMGVSGDGRVLVVIHTYPVSDESGEELIRIVSARKANGREEAVYMRRKL